MQKSAFALLVAASLILINVLSIGLFGRLDLTRDKAFTLSEATRETLDQLEDPVKVTAYFTENLPPPFADNARYVKDLLEEYRAASGGDLSFEFLDPMTQESEEDKAKKKDLKRDIFGRTVREKTSVETELEGVGIQPVEVRVFEADQQQTKRAYMGLVVRYGEEKETIPVVQDMGTLEYDLTTIVRRLVREKQPVIGVVQGHGEPSLEENLGRFTEMLKPNYESKAVTLSAGIPDDVDSLLVVGPQQAYTPEELGAIDAFLMKGKAAAFFIDRNAIDFRSFAPTANAQNVDQLTAAYGIELGQQVVGDVECASLSVQEKRGFMTINMPMKYPFIPMPKTLEGNSAMTKGIGDITLPFPVPLYPNSKLEGVEVQALAKSSPKSWLEDPTTENLNPRRDWNTADITVTGPYTLIAQARGLLPSFATAGSKSVKEARVIVAGSSALLNDQVMGPQNAALVLNMIDWLSLDAKLLDMRTRGLAEAAFAPDLSDAARNTIKWGNVIGAPLLLALFGLLRWRLREAKRKGLLATLTSAAVGGAQ